jgi:hypothetical protein
MKQTIVPGQIMAGTTINAKKMEANDVNSSTFMGPP